MIIIYFTIRTEYIILIFFLCKIEIPKKFDGPHTVMYVEETWTSRKLSTRDMTQ